MKPEEGTYPNTLGYLCYYGRHTDGIPQFEEARKWFELGTKLNMIESTYKLADMLYDGLGGAKDIRRAVDLYNDIYWYCRTQFEKGIVDCKFADIALRVGKLFYDGICVEKDDFIALSYLLEARYAITKRKPFNRYGDDTVEKNIEAAIAACVQPPMDERKKELVEFPFGRIPHFFLMDGFLMSFRLAMSDDGYLRINFVRRDVDGQWGRKVLWPVPFTMECFFTCFITVYGEKVEHVWHPNPGKEVYCDRYEYDEETDLHLFYLKDDLKCVIVGGDYFLSMEALRPGKMKEVIQASELDPYKKEIVEAAEKYKDEHTGVVVEIRCPICGQEQLYVNTDDNRLFAFCHNCHVSIDTPWPYAEPEDIPFDDQRTWTDL